MFAFGISPLPSELFVYLLPPLMLLPGISLDTSNTSLAWRRQSFLFTVGILPVIQARKGTGWRPIGASDSAWHGQPGAATRYCNAPTW